MMVTRSAPVCGLTNPSGPERFRSETHRGDYRTEHAAISSRGAAPAVTFPENGPRAYAGTTGTLSLRKARISCSLLFRCALTSSGGVSASH